MKTQILIALGAVAALAGAANAQTVPNNGGGVHLRNVPDIGPLFRVPITPAPQFDQGKTKGTRLKIVKSFGENASGENALLVEAGQQSIGEVLQKIADVMGVKVVIDAQLQKETHARLFFVGKDFDDLLNSISQAMNLEMVKSPAGTYFFAAKVAPVKGPTLYYQMPDGTYKRSDDLLPGGVLRIIPPPFNGAPLPSGQSEKSPSVDPDFTLPKNFARLQPLPNWEKREFNGHEFYYIPGLPPAKFDPIK